MVRYTKRSLFDVLLLQRKQIFIKRGVSINKKWWGLT